MKRYIKPEIEVIELETGMLLAGSDTLNNRPPGNDDYDNVFSKGHKFSIWDEDEDDE